MARPADRRHGAAPASSGCGILTLMTLIAFGLGLLAAARIAGAGSNERGAALASSD
jgi:hypothetical protein